MNYNEKLHLLRQNRSSKWSNRIITELTYLQKLFVSKGIDPTAEYLKTVDYVFNNLEQNGGIVKENTLMAEEMLRELTPLAKEYTMYMVAHAHIDINWCWDYSETITTTVDTFRTMLDLLCEYPQFVFSQSQAATYAIIEEFAPYMLPEIRHRIQEGRWEVTATSWVEADRNMPNGESIAHQILYTKKYMNRLFEIKNDDLVIDFEPDAFGHSQNIPEFLNKGGIKYFYYCRGFHSGHFLFKWKSPSGASVIAYEDSLWYSSIIEPDIIESCPDICHTSKTNIMLKLYGIGDHGGGPSRRDIERIIEYATWPLAPKFEFGTLKGYFERVEKEFGDKLPVIERDFNYLFQGCYSSQARIKMANRVGEQRMYDAEVLTSFARMMGQETYTVNGLEKGWQRVLQNQFHDILPGSCVMDTREHALGRFQEAAGYANVAAKNALLVISDNIDTSEIITDDDPDGNSNGAGAGEQAFRYGISCTERGQGKVRIYHLFNTTAYESKGVHQIVVWSWPHETNRARVVDERGNPLPFSLTSGDESWFYQHFTLNIETAIPAFGYTTVVLSVNEMGNFVLSNGNKHHRENVPYSNILENEKIKAVFDDVTLELTSLVDRQTGKELIATPTARIMYNVEQSHDMAAWEMGEFILSQSANINYPVKVIERNQGGVRQWIKYSLKVNNSEIEVTANLKNGSNALEFFIAYDMMDFGTDKTCLPRFDFAFKPANSFTRFKNDIPGGIITREVLRDDVPANSFIAAGGFMLISDNKHGYNGNHNTLSTCLARAAYYPDKYSETYHHETRLAVIPVDESNDSELIRQASLFRNQASVVSGRRHKGELLKTGSFISVEGNAAVSGIKPAEDSRGIIIRLNAIDEGGVAKIMSSYKNAFIVNLNEVDGAAIALIDSNLCTKIRKGEVLSLRLC